MDDELSKIIRDTIPLLNEKQRRQYLAKKARDLGYGGIARVSDISKVSRNTIARGIREISAPGYRWDDSARSRETRKHREPAIDEKPATREDGAAIAKVLGYAVTEERQSEDIKAILAGGIGRLMRREGATVGQLAEIVGLDEPRLTRALYRSVSEVSLHQMLGCVHALGYGLRVEAIKNGKFDPGLRLRRADGDRPMTVATGQGQDVEEREASLMGPQRAPAPSRPDAATNDDDDDDKGPLPWDDDYGNEAQENKEDMDDGEDLPF
jgi:DNA-binding phage protein